MGRGASANQVSTAAKPAGANGAPAGRTALAAARRWVATQQVWTFLEIEYLQDLLCAVCRRRPGTNKGAPANKQPPGQPNMNSGMLKFYTDDAPGLKM